MNELKFDFNSQRNQFAEAAGIDERVTEEDFKRNISTFAIITFKANPEKEGVISKYKGMYVFKEGSSDQTVIPGDTWLCNLRLFNEVYYAMPILKITPAILMGFSTELCNAIVDALWEKNRKDYESIFESRYKEAMYKRVSEEMSSEKEEELETLRRRITELERDLEASRFAIDAASDIEPDRDEIELSSEPKPQVQESRRQETAAEPVSFGMMPIDDHKPMISEAYYSRPYLSQPRYTEELMRPARSITVNVQHVSDKLLFSDSFPNGRCFVHVSPNLKFMLIRADSEGPVYCVNHHIMLNDLEKIIPFTEKMDLKAEYSTKYKGILIHLDI